MKNNVIHCVCILITVIFNTVHADVNEIELYKGHKFALGLSAVVLMAGMNAQYKLTPHIGAVLGITSFNADVTIDESLEKTNVNYAFGGLFIGLHFVY